MPGLELQGLHKQFGEVVALRTLNLVVESGEFVSLLGPSGCGKTTILNVVVGLIRPAAGEALLDGQPPQLGDPGVGYLLARDALLPWRTTINNVALPLELRGVPSDERMSVAERILGAVGLADFRNAFPAQLSHGMRQRTALARTLAPGPATLLMDEPFAALDAQTRLTLHEMFLRLWEEQKSTVLFVTHDLAEAITLADRAIVMSARPGRVKGDFRIELPRPRHVMELQSNSEYHRLFQQIWEGFREEIAVR